MPKRIPLDALGELADAVYATNLPPTPSVSHRPSPRATNRQRTRIMADDTYTATTTFSHPGGASPTANPLRLAR